MFVKEIAAIVKLFSIKGDHELQMLHRLFLRHLELLGHLGAVLDLAKGLPRRESSTLGRPHEQQRPLLSE